MPEGIDTQVEDGYAVIDFVDPALRGQGLQALLDTGAPIEVQTRTGPRKRYRVPEGNAREAGLLDSSKGSVAAGDTGYAKALQDVGSRGGRPEQPTSRNAHTEAVGQSEVANVPTVSTTVEGTSLGDGVAPSHAALIGYVHESSSVLGVGGTQPVPTADTHTRREIDEWAAQLSPPVDTTKATSKADALAMVEKAKS